MAEEIKKIYARIGGMSYHLVTSENELYTRQIAAKADEMINRVMQNNPYLNQNMATILALVNAVDELNGLYAKQNAVDSQKLEMEKQTGDIRKELMRLREQNWEMKKEILRLNDLCQDYQALITKLTTPGESTRTDILEDARLADRAAEAPAAEAAAAPLAEAAAAPLAEAAAAPLAEAAAAPTAEVAAAPAAAAKPVVLTFDGGDVDDLTENQDLTGDVQADHSEDAAIDAPSDEAVDAAGADADYEADDDIEPPDLGKLLSAANAAKAQQTAPSRPTLDKQAAPQTIDEIMGRTSSRSSQQAGDLKQTNLDDYLRATGWPQTYETKKHDS